MTVLSEETLQADALLALANTATRQRGQNYAHQGRARLERVDAREAVFTVTGTQSYQVEIALADDGEIEWACDCPVGSDDDDNEAPCKHVVAAVIVLRNYLRANPPVTWDSVLDRALKSAAPRGTGAGGAALVLVFGLQKRYSEWSIIPFALAMSHFTGVDTADPDALAQTIKKSRLGREAKPVRSLGNPRRFVNLSPSTQIAVQMAALSYRYGYYSYASGDSEHGLAALLPHLTNALVYRGTETAPLQTRLRLPDAPVVPVLDVTEEDDNGLRVRALLVSDAAESDFALADTEPLTSGDPLYALAGSDTIVRVDDVVGIARTFAKTPEITVPAGERDAFFERYLVPLASRIEIRGLDIVRHELVADPVPRLYLSEDDGQLQATLRFGYDACELPFDKTLPPTSLQYQPETKTLVRVVRQPAREEQAYTALSDFRLKRSSGGEPGAFVPRVGVDAVDFLVHQIPRLLEAGYEVYGEAALKTARINRSRPTISFAVASGIDWFDVEAVVHFGDLEVSLVQLKRAVKKGEKYLKLADNSLGAIPPEWLERYKHLFGLSDETEKGLRLASGQITLLDQLAESEDAVLTGDADFAQRRERLRNFSSIAAKPLPVGFTGALRPYQKAGVDWLHFLREYGFGGCLADDMGLGKTAQTLAFLQSLKETEPDKPSLLVMPRSLIFNWEREAARFTPGLRLLNHAEPTRATDPSAFAAADLILTTYGILRRDIELLKNYPFRCVVLDEAQAIKNPASQSARAARLLRAENRLSLTGTPVENSTLELWSQFAFLNPGLLGSLEYFRAEFATAIEKRRDETAAAFLRKMVHPFLLRRTKDQVASDLPPRTERIVYTEMEPAQKQLYQEKRDYYRALVLGLIEKEGMNDARMKILEGLLRLRQIANHPALVAPGSVTSGKMDGLLETLETLHAEGHKALVFSQFVQMLRLIRNALDARKIPHAYLDGQTKDRQARVDAFQSDPSLPFFLISLKAGGVGLNLTAADYVIHVDPWWNPAVEMQATDRTHRIGQTKPVFVYKLIARETVEEKILLLQERKRALVSQLIATESGFFKSLSRDDIELLFT